MDKTELLKKLAELAEDGDFETVHSAADEALIDYIGDKEIAEAYAKVGKWYA